ncbi:UNVERIFIED_CONTAM: hypothetical protein HDU68_000389 [Siphonaria sp. JEL0065]|nr:hypothetical protein HDU68_000389 [Siphonaria sp. JEL0065]
MKNAISANIASASTTPPKDTNRAYVLPFEIWEQIASNTDCTTIVPLSHAIPCLKHISKALYDVGASFKMSVDWLWPNMYLPVLFRKASSMGLKTLPYDILDSRCIFDEKRDEEKEDKEEKNNSVQNKPPTTVQTLTKLVTRHGGVVKVMAHSVAYFDSIQPFLPKTIDVYIPASQNGDLYDVFVASEDESYGIILETITQQYNHKIRSLDLPFEDDDGTDCLVDSLVLKAAKKVEILPLIKD